MKRTIFIDLLEPFPIIYIPTDKKKLFQTEKKRKKRTNIKEMHYSKNTHHHLYRPNKKKKKDKRFYIQIAFSTTYVIFSPHFAHVKISLSSNVIGNFRNFKHCCFHHSLCLFSIHWLFHPLF